MHKFAPILSLIFLCSCGHLVQDSKDVAVQVGQDAITVQDKTVNGVMRVATDLRDGIKRTGEHTRNWFLAPLPSKEKLPMPQRYCYRVLQDILCYREQVIGWENKLVGYQGKDASAPAPVVTQQLPLRNNNASSSPTARITSSKPVFAKIPTDAKDVKDANPETITVDGSHEALPDSPLAPQL